MTNEKESIRKILEGRGVISNGVFDELRFRKLVTEPWIHTKTIKYGFDKMNETVDCEVLDTVNDSFKPIALTNEMIDTPVKESELIETDTEEPVVEIQEPITVVEEPVVEEPVVAEEVVETSTESVLLEEDLKEEIEEPVIDECPLYEEAPVVVEEPTVEVVEEVVDTTKKKTTKKK